MTTGSPHWAWRFLTGRGGEAIFLDRVGLPLFSAAVPRADRHTCGWGWHPPPPETKAGPMLLTSTQLDALSPGSWQSGRKSALDHPTSPTSGNKAHHHFVEWVRRAVTALVERLSWRVATVGARLYAVGDRTAIQHGWTITRRRGGLARTYRDPRFDTLLACPRCDGEGSIDDEACTPCSGTGRVTRGPTRPAEQGQAAPFEGQRP